MFGVSNYGSWLHLHFRMTTQNLRSSCEISRALVSNRSSPSSVTLLCKFKNHSAGEVFLFPAVSGTIIVDEWSAADVRRETAVKVTGTSQSCSIEYCPQCCSVLLEGWRSWFQLFSRTVIQHCDLDSACRLRVLEAWRRQAVMALKVRSTTRRTLSRFTSMSVYICICSFFTGPQLSVSPWAESLETECPCEEDGERAEQEQVVSSSVRRRSKCRRRSVLWWQCENGNQLKPITSCTGHLPVIAGHQFAGGLCAPLLI